MTTLSAPWSAIERRHWRPVRPMTLSEWADTYRVFPQGDPEPGPHRTARFPPGREIMDVMGDEVTREVVLWGPTQTVKTTLICSLLGYAIHYDPSPALVVYPTEETARAFAEDKLEPMIEACPALRERAEIGTARTLRKSVLSKMFPGMKLEIRGGNSENSFASRSVRYAIADELDRIPPNREGRPADLLRQRCQNYWNRKLILSSTCTTEGASEIAMEYETSDQRRYHVPCLACGHMHVMSARNIDYDGATDPAEAQARARYRCPQCRHEHTDRDKPAMLARGEWRAARPGRGKVGFWWSALYSPWVPFGQLTYEYLSANQDDDARRVYWNCRLAKLWKERTEAPAASVLDACIDRDRGRGVVPPEALILTGGADVQKHVVYWVVRAWGPNGQSWLVNHGVTERADGRLDWLDDVFGGVYGGRPVTLALIDSGWDEEVVYDYCLARRNCHPSKGMPRDVEFDVKDSEQKREKGQYRGHQFILWLVNSHKLRAHIHDRIPLPADAPRAWRLHSDIDGEYRRHILARERVIKKLQNRLVVDWNNPDRDDHYLDAEIYALAASRTKFIAPLLVAGRLPAPRPAPVRREKSDAWAVKPLGRL